MTAIGERWPHPHPGGMQAVLAPDEEAGLQLTLVAACDRPTERESEALTGPLRLGILSHPPLAWITLHAGILSWDAPYAAGITAPDHAVAIGVGARRAAGLPDRFRALVVITLLDSGIVTRKPNGRRRARNSRPMPGNWPPRLACR